MDQLSAAPVLKKISVIHYLNSLVPVPFIGRAACRGGRADAGVDLGSGFADRNPAGFVRCQQAHPPNGNQIRQRLMACEWYSR